MISNLDLSLVIPCYNEEKNLNHLLKNVKEVLESSKFNLQVILVNNGSIDNTSKVFESFKKNNLNLNLKILNLMPNLGYGGGILEGLKIADGRILSWTHADLQTDINDIKVAYKNYISNESKNIRSIIKGKRKKRKILDVIFTKLMTYFIFAISGRFYDDINAQPKLFSREIYNDFDHPPKDFLLDFYLLTKAVEKNYKIKTFNVFFKKRLHGEAKGGGTIIGKIKLSFKSIKYILKLHYGNNNSQN